MALRELNDTDFEDYLVESVERLIDGYDVCWDTYWHIFIRSRLTRGVIPKVGSKLRLFKTSNGEIRGIFIDGKKVFYQQEGGRCDGEETKIRRSLDSH